MMNTSNPFAHAVRAALTLGVLAVLSAPMAVHAQTHDLGSSPSFFAGVSEQRDVVLARIEDRQRDMTIECSVRPEEVCYIDHVAPGLSSLASELEAYASRLAGLEAPDELSADIETYVVALRAEADALRAAATAVAAGDHEAAERSKDERLAILAEVAAQLDPEWARAAFLTSFGRGDRILDYAGRLTPDEQAYLESTHSVYETAAASFSCFGQALRVSPTGVEHVLAALVDCGAGGSLPLVEAAARELEPPARFTEEHAWWLGVLAEQSRLDRSIGQAAADGDVAGFLADNARIGLVGRPGTDLDPAFLRGYPGPGAALDPAEPLARTSYGFRLFRVLADYHAVNPMNAALGTIHFPQVPREQALPAVLEIGSELRALDDELRDELDRLEPPPELADDHRIMSEFFRLLSRGLDELVEAAEAGDVEATLRVQEAATGTYCAASASLSEAILPVASVFFDRSDPSCVGPG